MRVPLGAGSRERPIPDVEAKDWGLAHWARPILEVLMDGSADTTADCAEEWPLGIVAQTGAVEIGDEIFLEVVVAWDRTPLAALLTQPHPEATVWREDVIAMPSTAPIPAKE